MTPAEAVFWDQARSLYPEATVARMLWALTARPALRELLAEVLERVEQERDQNNQHYGYFLGGDPRDFVPDPECCTAVEMEAHRLAVEAAERGDPGARDVVTALPGSLSHSAIFGHGTTTYRDADGDGVIAALRSVVESLPVETEQRLTPRSGTKGTP